MRWQAATNLDPPEYRDLRRDRPEFVPLAVKSSVPRLLYGVPVQPRVCYLTDERLLVLRNSLVHSEVHAKNVVICTRQISRSLYWTGTCARAAALWARGDLRVDAEFVSEDLAGEFFRVRPVAVRAMTGQQGIVLRLSGWAYVTGMHQFVIDPADPFRYGFALPAA